jgi:protein gp37
MGKTKIEWADSVWNPVTGCTPVSEGCERCFARRMARDLQRGNHCMLNRCPS